jgi:hypothetical protein
MNYSKNTVIETHSHPSGTKEVDGHTYSFHPVAPSKQDIQKVIPSQIDVVIGMASGLTYLYNETGVIAVLPTRRYCR